MHACLPAWPQGLPRKFFPIATIRAVTYPEQYRSTLAKLDALCLKEAWHRLNRREEIQCATASWSELLFSNTADYAALASSAVEASLMAAGPKEQPVFPQLFFNQPGKGVSIIARGVLSTTGTPTMIFQARLGTTSGPTFLSGTSVGVSAAITTASGITNKWWELRLDLISTVPGIGTTNSTLCCAGYVKSPGGFASPFTYALEPTTPDTATWTATLDSSLTQYFNLSQTWSASSASNTITMKQLLALALN